MNHIDKWMEKFCRVVRGSFGERVRLIGIQGSRGRDEARENSDIDVVVILDELRGGDLKLYRKAIASLPEREKVCGFVSGMGELEKWDRADLFQFCLDTRTVYGSMDTLRERITAEDAQRAALAGACSIYHMCAHNYLHERDDAILASLYKSAIFTIQAKYYCQTGRYLKKHCELAQEFGGTDGAVLKKAVALKADPRALSIEKDTEPLLFWAQRTIEEYGQ